eukprot:Skav216333  [mRNA]  locus=scaffold3350:284303:297512:+ [translate_table: standard]
MVYSVNGTAAYGHMAAKGCEAGKGIVALGAFAELLQLDGQVSSAKKFRALAQGFADKWIEMAQTGHTYTKADWSTWAAAFGGKAPWTAAHFEAVVEDLWKFATSTPDRAPKGPPELQLGCREPPVQEIQTSERTWMCNICKRATSGYELKVSRFRDGFGNGRFRCRQPLQYTVSRRISVNFKGGHELGLLLCSEFKVVIILDGRGVAFG